MQQVSIQPIGVINTSFTEKSGVPIQAKYGDEFVGEILLETQYVEGLKDLDGFSHIHLIYHFNQHSDYQLQVVPYMDDQPRGVFATRAPTRPSGIGMSLVRLLSVEGNRIRFAGVDMLDGSPLLDIKPYYRDIDERTDAVCGWLEQGVERQRTRSDGRF
ncbi:tRNA (N6-threonylcarbamoyladenosine(37)-N6)-methyltransferase TrmO [Pelagibaculum spongiae]|uniref:tRNA (N6-threonylcarbamoyladenosine(37)-N6)-methyltransferase TrmO n=1 Tax=Pelagibaculum spongiae TaxID=2080658 RepID=A0A2V1GW06_9GAMM|nr:tRNA (N6-threonylcarbamoyladenosine(37)-N6)-methyltransferase TrmO [Pelagibaculum spongiae]PVZ68837.1 tRNA (N6-threonylcarbamoyladenosine(37)-N6)-methyltransferase TrmO [Pelagibaculum spongiae]